MLGYRTSASRDGRNPHLAADRAQAKRVADALKQQGRWQEGADGKPVAGAPAQQSVVPAQQSVVR